MDFADAVNAWLAQPDDTRLSELYLAIQAQPNYTTAPNFIRAAEALRLGDYTTALNQLSRWMPGAFLSPLAHGMLARALAGLGRREAAVLETRLARAALVTIFNSGDGSRSRPWLVLRVSDEYDVLEALEDTVERQTPVEDGHRFLDRIDTRQGTTHWFEIRRGGRRAQGVAA